MTIISSSSLIRTVGSFFNGQSAKNLLRAVVAMRAEHGGTGWWRLSDEIDTVKSGVSN